MPYIQKKLIKNMHKNNYEVHLLINGKPAREYYHEGKFYVEARKNTEYTIKVKNHGHKKIMAIISVDGIDVLKGRSAIDAESGYIINPYSSTEIKGYRINDDNVATFKFDDGKVSYSTQVEQKFDKKKIQEVKEGKRAPSKNNGVIGVRIWEEKAPVEIPDWELRSKPSKRWFYNSNCVNNYPRIGGIYYSGACAATGSLTTGSSINWSNCLLSGSGGFSHSVGGTVSADYTSNNNQQEYILLNNNTRADDIDWTQWEIDTPRTDVNQFGNLETIDRVNLPPPRPRRRRNRILFQSETVYSCASSTPSRSYIPNFSVGTTWGQQTEDKIVKVTFEKAETYIDLELFYLQREELIKLGIDIYNAKKIFVSGYPEAFGEKEEYCKQPINWRKE